MLRTLTVVLAVSLLGQTIFAADKLILPPELVGEWKEDMAWIAAGRALDVGMTEWALSRGLREGNPLMQNRGVRIGASAVFVVAGGLACRELRQRGHPGKAKWLSRGIFALSAGLAVNALVRGLDNR